MTGLAVGVDVGGTKLAAGLVASDGSVLAHRREETQASDPQAIVSTIVDIVRSLAEGAGNVPVGVAAAGLVDDYGVVRYGPNIAWDGHSLRDDLAAKLDTAVAVDNDANAAAWGEFRVGAGKDMQSSLLMLTVGTGVGGGLVQGGTLFHGKDGYGAEFGHIIIDEGGPQCPCGNLGCLEAHASGSAIGRLANELVDAGEGGAVLPGLAVLNGKTVTVAAHAGDPVAIEVLRRSGTWLGIGVASLVNALAPEIVVLGGGAMQAGDLLLEPCRKAAAARLMGRPERQLPPVVRARLADDAGLVGAALLALDAAAAAGA